MANLYLNKKKDADLYGLLEDVGSIRFCKIAKACLRALFDNKQALLAREMATEGVNEGNKGGEYSEKGVLFRISTTANRDEYLKAIMDSLIPGSTSTFVKATMRQVLGPQILLKYFLLPGASISIGEIKPMMFVNINVEGNEKRPRVKRKMSKSKSKIKPTSRTVETKKMEKPVSIEKKETIEGKVYVDIIPNRPDADLCKMDGQMNQPPKLLQDDGGANKVDQAESNGLTDGSEMDLLSMLEAML